MSGKKRKQANLLDPNFLQALIAPNNDENDDTTAPVVLQFTNGAYAALNDCQEKFIQHLAHQLKEDNNNNSDNEQKVRHVQQSQVEEAMRNMGLDDVLEQALEYLKQQAEAENEEEEEEEEDNNMKPAAKKRKSKKKIGMKSKFTAEMAAEQERLLQASASRQKQED